MRARILALAFLSLASPPCPAQAAGNLAALLLAAARRDAVCIAESESLQARLAGLEAAYARSSFGLSFSASAQADAAPFSPSYGLPLGAGASISITPPPPPALAAALEANRAAIAIEGRRSLNEAAYRILQACLRAVSARTACERAESRALRAAASSQRTRGAEEDSARAALAAAQSALDLEEARRDRDRALTAAKGALGVDPPSLEEILAFLAALPSGGGPGGKAEAAGLTAKAKAADAALLEAEPDGIMARLGLLLSIDPLDAADASLSLTGSLSYTAPGPSSALRREAAARAAAAAASAAEAEARAQEARLSELDQDIGSIERRMLAAGDSLAAATALAALVEGRFALGAIAASERDAMLELVATKEASREALSIELAFLLLERARLGWLLIPALEAP